MKSHRQKLKVSPPSLQQAENYKGIDVKEGKSEAGRTQKSQPQRGFWSTLFHNFISLFKRSSKIDYNSELRSKPGFENNKDAFNQLLKLMHKGKKEPIKAKLNEFAKDPELNDFLKLKNNKGETLAHRLIKDKQYEAFGILATTFQNDLDLSATDSKGRTVLDLIKKTKNIHYVNYYNTVTAKDGLNQTALLAKFQSYLQIMHKNDPAAYQKDDINLILKDLESGHCSGLSLIWMHQNLLGQVNEFSDIIDKISTWDGREASLTEDLKTELEYTISTTRWYHQTFSESGEESNIQRTSQTDFETIIGREGQFENKIALAFIWTKPELAELLDQFMFEDNVMRLVANEHAIATGLEDNFDPAMKAIKLSSSEELVDEIEKRLYTNLDQNSNGNIGVTIESLEKTGSGITYPDINELMSKQLIKRRNEGLKPDLITGNNQQIGHIIGGRGNTERFLKNTQAFLTQFSENLKEILTKAAIEEAEKTKTLSEKE